MAAEHEEASTVIPPTVVTRRSGLDLSGSVAIVTGASSGIGRAAALRLAELGADIVANSGPTSQVALDEVADRISKMGRNVAIFNADITDPETSVQLVKMAQDSMFPNGFDIVVHAAGITGMDATARRIKEEEHRKIMDANYYGFLYFLREATHPKGIRNNGSIAFVSSVVPATNISVQVAYSAAKIAGEQLVRAQVAELTRKGRGVRINSIAPGAVDTRMLRDAEKRNPGTIAKFIEVTPLGRLVTPEEVADGIAFLVSDMSLMVTGAILDVNGGMFLRS
jgi:NAD(P)-dependent dehydrogenase (short-subunit alcohol dehydrogenase family)